MNAAEGKNYQWLVQIFLRISLYLPPKSDQDFLYVPLGSVGFYQLPYGFPAPNLVSVTRRHCHHTWLKAQVLNPTANFKKPGNGVTAHGRVIIISTCFANSGFAWWDTA